MNNSKKSAVLKLGIIMLAVSLIALLIVGVCMLFEAGKLTRLNDFIAEVVTLLSPQRQDMQIEELPEVPKNYTTVREGETVTVSGILTDTDEGYYLDLNGDYLSLVTDLGDGKLQSVLCQQMKLDISDLIYENHTDELISMTGVITSTNGIRMTLCDPDCDCCITYKVVEPTEEELGEVHERIGELLCNYSYISTDDTNIYDILFWNRLNQYINLHYPNYSTEFEAHFGFSMSEYEYVLGNDPLGYYGEMPPSEWFDQQGNCISREEYQTYCEEHPEHHGGCGYIKFNAAALDWYIEGVLNLKADHKQLQRQPTLVTSNGSSNESCTAYYYDGAYYDILSAVPDGLGSPPLQYTDSISEPVGIGNNMYKIYYTINAGGPTYEAEATIALKEASNGFRFWSVYEITEN